jgi:hypothetical protein
MTLAYKKNKNTGLFAQLADVIDVQSAQNYSPLYKRFFELNETNWNHVNLSTDWRLDNLLDADTATITGSTDSKEVYVFFKMCPLLDPSRYLMGEYADYDFSLPSLTKSPMPKLGDVNNSAYVDGFFYFLSDKLKTQHDFVHGLSFYGNFLGVKSNFEYNMDMDFEMCANREFFRNNVGVLFDVNQELPSLPKLELGDDVDLEVDEVDVAREIGKDDYVVVQDVTETLEVAGDLKLRNYSACSSKSSDSDDDDERPEVDELDDESEDEQEMVATIKRFPVQVVAMERCNDTLDNLLGACPPEEMESALMQVVMILLVYQKVYKFTHNDLHTNNIMYIDTDKPFLYYVYENTAYKVPTFGRIFKLIDFGRSIYTFQGERFVSDSFGEQGDAQGQYNIEPFFDKEKPMLDANYSFDLCRLACSMLDTLPTTPEFDDLNKLVEEWCADDKGRNVLFKKNGDERYPNFKLYKMIARTVHRHTPEEQLKRSMFNKYVVKKKTLRDKKVCNVDEMPVLA